MSGKKQYFFFLFMMTWLISCHHNEEHDNIKIPPETSRDNAARMLTLPQINSDLETKDISWEQLEIYIQAFKHEQELEVWVKNKLDNKYQLLYSYPFCANSGKLGPKRMEGDRQIPEGIYHIAIFNPVSQFHLSLGINYPNKSDLKFSHPQKPGSDIYIHGGCMTIGCIPLTDKKINVLYTLSQQAHRLGQQQIPVHIFPYRMKQHLHKKMIAQYPEHLSFWHSLQPIYLQFQQQKALTNYKILNDGYYHLP